MLKLPKCSKWNLWEGKEIEGNTDLGTKTLFVRAGNFEKYKKKFSRIWFCKEYRNFDKIRNVIDTHQVALEVTLNDISEIPSDVFQRVKIYLKVDATLKNGDEICIGTPFYDEAFLIGSGNSVHGEQYQNDKELK